MSSIKTITTTNGRPVRTVVRTTGAPRQRTKRGKQTSKMVPQAIRQARRPAMKVVSSYFNSLVDPFLCPGPRLGWGCLIPTQLGSAKARGSFVSNPDGSASCLFELSPGGICNTALSPIRYNLSTVSGPAVYTFGVASANAATAQASVANLRVISAGVRFFAQVPDTAVQPVVDFGNIPRPASMAGIEVLTTAQLSNTTHLERTVTRDNSWTITWRPQDPLDYTFDVRSSNQAVGTVPAITFQNLPPSTNILYEYVVHYEYYSSIEAGADVADISVDPSSEPRVSDAGTVEQVFSMLPARLLAATQQYVGAFSQAAFNAMGHAAAQPLNSFNDSLYGFAAGLSTAGATYGARNLLRIRG